MSLCICSAFRKLFSVVISAFVCFLPVTHFQLLTTTSSSSLNPTFYSGIYHINMAKQSNTKVSSGDEVAVAINNQLQHTPTLQVPDFLSLSKKELIAQLQAYNVHARKDKTKDALANQLRQHYITKILPGLVKNHDGYLNYNGGNYRFYYQKKNGFIFKCSRYRHPDKTWTSRYAVTKAYSEMASEPTFDNCPGTLFVQLTGAGTLSSPQLPPPFHQCGCLNSIQTMDLGYQDTRPALEMISPSITFVDVLTEEKRQAVRESLSSRSIHWDGLSGGKFRNTSLRKFILDLHSQPKINTLVKQVMAPLVATVQAKYPTLLYVKYGALKSLPRCPSQYEGHDHRLHSDYPKLHSDIPADQRPVSIILGLDAFKFIYLPHLTLTRKDMISLLVPAGHGIIFTNACLHSGGENDSDQTKVRVFAYMASDLSHIPHNKVTKYDWSSDSEDATIGFATHTGGEDEDLSSSGRAADGP